MNSILQDGQTLRIIQSDGSKVILDRNGKVVEVVEDGARVRVPMIFMDAAKTTERKPLALVDASAHRPHQIVATTDAIAPAMAMLTPEQRAQFDGAYAKRKKLLESAWKGGR